MVQPGIAVEKSLTIESDNHALRKIQDAILDEVSQHNFDSHSQFAIRLALEEALINAIKHGNKYDPKKKVHVEYTTSDKQLEVIIEDEGPGFEREVVPDPTLEENIEKCSGRGILLIEAYMDHVEWTLGGRRVHMIKKNENYTKPPAGKH